MKKAILKIYCFILIIGILYFAALKLARFSFPCFFYSTTGMLCPGCGTTRMFLNLFELKFADAFFCNPVVFVLMLFWMMVSVLCFIGKPKFITNHKFLYVTFYITIFVLLLFGVLRNLT